MVHRLIAALKRCATQKAGLQFSEQEGKSKSPHFDRLRAGFFAQKAREKWGTRCATPNASPGVFDAKTESQSPYLLRWQRLSYARDPSLRLKNGYGRDDAGREGSGLLGTG